MQISLLIEYALARHMLDLNRTVSATITAFVPAHRVRCYDLRHVPASLILRHTLGRIKLQEFRWVKRPPIRLSPLPRLGGSDKSFTWAMSTFGESFPDSDEADTDATFSSDQRYSTWRAGWYHRCRHEIYSLDKLVTRANHPPAPGIS